MTVRNLRRRYASMQDPLLEAAILGSFSFNNLVSALKRLEQIKRRYTLSRYQFSPVASPAQDFSALVRLGMERYQEERPHKRLKQK